MTEADGQQQTAHIINPANSGWPVARARWPPPTSLAVASLASIEDVTAVELPAGSRLSGSEDADPSGAPTDATASFVCDARPQ
jgi:hypothetical protein